MRLRRVLSGLVVCWLLAGCAAGPGTLVGPPEVESSVPATPARGQSLSALGFNNGPADLIWLPSGVRVAHVADQPNALIVIGGAAEGPQIQDYLRQTLPGLGWQITADAPGGLLFQQAEWQGAYALGAGSWALTVRND